MTGAVNRPADDWLARIKRDFDNEFLGSAARVYGLSALYGFDPSRGSDFEDDDVNNPINSPAHYTSGGIEAIDYIAAKLGPAGFRAYCLGNVLKYVSRHEGKGGDEDLEKAAVYLRWAIDGRRQG